MRCKWDGQTFFDFSPMDPKQLEYIELLEHIVDKADHELDLVALDLARGADLHRGREGMSASMVLRFALVKQMHQFSYEQLYARVHDSIALRRFCQCEFDHVPKPSTLQENIKKIRAETFEEINRMLLRFARQEKIDDGRKARIDSTGVETDIHYPTDSRLIEDAVRVTTRILYRARLTFPQAGISFHDRTRVVKKRVFAIANAKTAEQREVLYRELLGYAEEVFGYGKEGVVRLRKIPGASESKQAAWLAADDLTEIVELMEKIIDQTRRRVMEGEKVPSADKVTSIFEPHTDIIEKGERETLFGHKVCVTVGKTNLVLDCQIERGNPADTSYFQEALDRHRQVYGYVPDVVATDGGFASAANALYAKQMGVKDVSFSKRVGRKLQELLVPKSVERMLAKFRAGVEGIISSLKRGVGLGRCAWSGWESFQSYVWSSIVAHNLKRLTEVLVARRRKTAVAT